jgi:hypothetical protein
MGISLGRAGFCDIATAQIVKTAARLSVFEIYDRRGRDIGLICLELEYSLIIASPVAFIYL